MNKEACEILQEKTETASHPFGIFNIELTNKCPMKCLMCPRTKNMTRPQGFMDRGIFARVIDEVAARNPAFIQDRVIWLHHFGESLLHPEASDFIRLAAAKGVRTGISLNPYMLTDTVAADLIQAAPHILYISLDGHDDESFFKIRGMPGAYDISLSRLLGFLELKKRHNAKTTIVVSMIDFFMNDESIVLKRSFWESCEGVDQFLAKGFTAWDGRAGDINALRKNICSGPADLDTSCVACTLPWEMMTVTWNGNVVPCCFDYNEAFVLGNIGKQSLEEIWNGPEMRSLRLQFLANNVTALLCRKCEKLYLPRNRWLW